MSVLLKKKRANFRAKILKIALNFDCVERGDFSGRWAGGALIFFFFFFTRVYTEREVRCNDPGQISNGIRSPAESIHSVGSEVHFRCVSGYSINGTANLTCMSDGQWSDDVPICQGGNFAKNS